MMRPRDLQLGLSRRCNADWPTESTTMTGELAEENEPEDSTTTPEAFTEDVEGTTRPMIRGRQRRLRSLDGRPGELSTMTDAL